MQPSVLDNAIPWRIQLFGALVVESPTGERVTLSVKKAGELLAYLALSPGQAHRREKLISVLWENADIGSARTRLRQEILKLRAQFGDETDRFALLRITSDDLQVQLGTQIDAVRFLTACAAAKQATEWEEKRRLYADIRSLYAADLLVEYDAPWILAERARISGLYEQSLRDCAEQHRQRRTYAEAEEALQCLLAHSPGWEESYIALMRLFAEQGQPGRVQEQYAAMQRMLREKYETVPDEALRRLAESLRADASLRAVGRPSPTLLPASEASAQQNGAEAPSVGQGSKLTVDFEAPPVHLLPLSLPPGPAPTASGRMSRHPRRRLAALFVILCGPLFLWIWRFSHQPSTRLSGPPALLRHQEKWTYVYQPRPGETPNAEGTAVAVDRTGIYITGFVATEKDDTDILTIKLDFNGKPLWVDRYSSPEHDCDRASSIAARPEENSVYVGGETYVPDHVGVPGAWRLTLLRYKSDGPPGKRYWVRRSPVAVKHGERMQVCNDGREGAYFAGTALIGNRTEILLLHYDIIGHLTWKRVLDAGKQTTFGALGVGSDGRLYCCGTARMAQGDSGPDDRWLIACLNPDGSILWQKQEQGPNRGRHLATRLILDRADNLYVAGLIDQGNQAGGGQGLKLAVERREADDGTKVWHSIVQESGPNIALEGLAVNFQGNVAVAGTEHRPDGNDGIVLARVDAAGNRNLVWRYAVPPGYRSSSVQALALGNHEEMRFFGQLSTGSSADMHLTSSILFGTCAHDGRLIKQSLFDTAPREHNHIKTAAYTELDGIVAVGQIGMADGQNELCVLQY